MCSRLGDVDRKLHHPFFMPALRFISEVRPKRREGMKVDGHLTPSLAGRVARETHCKRLVLTHFYPPCDSHDLAGVVKEQYGGDVILAEDLMRIVV